ncbi:DODA-type extradiol aromatic ring-opening family dioxygenase [Micromonospora sp. LZ34]
MADENRDQPENTKVSTMPNLRHAMVSSHAYAFLSPEQWDRRREVTRSNYEKLNGVPAPAERPEALAETLEANQERHEAISRAFEMLRETVRTDRPDVIVLVGDDQDENFTDPLRPQFAIYTGAQFAVRSGDREVTYRSDVQLARSILQRCVDADIDMAWVEAFADGRLRDHAHCEPLEFLDPDGEIPVVLVFLNSIHHPGPHPSRCYRVGEVLRQAIENYAPNRNVVLYSSGGFSHFTAGYPWKHYEGPHTLGSISIEFDEQVVADLRQGNGSRLAELTSADLLANGQVELRQTIVLAGAVGDGVRPDFLEYQPFFRAVLGMAVGRWTLS